MGVCHVGGGSGVFVLLKNNFSVCVGVHACTHVGVEFSPLSTSIVGMSY